MSDSLPLEFFTLFPLLPQEIRLLIWFYSLPPFRRIEREYDPRPSPAALFSTCLESQEDFLSHYSKFSATNISKPPGFFDVTVDTFEVGLVPWFDRHKSTVATTEISTITKVWMETDFYGLKGNILSFMRVVYCVNPQIKELTIFLIPRSKNRPFTTSTDRNLRHRGATLFRPCWNLFQTYTSRCKEMWLANGSEWKLPKLFVVEKSTEGGEENYSPAEERSFEDMVGDAV